MKKNIREMPRLTQAERNRAIGMADMGTSQRQIARTFNCSQASISNLLSRYQQTAQAQGLPRSGRPMVTTSAEDRYIRTIHLRNQSVTVTSTAATSLGHPINRRNSLMTTQQGWYQRFPPRPWNDLDPSTPSTQITMDTNCTSVGAA